MDIYKLTDQQMRTHNGFQWVLGETVRASGDGDLCGPGWVHAYTDPLLAVLLNPIHANFKNPRLFRGVGVIGKTDHGLKVGCTEMTLVEEIPLPQVSTTQRVAFGVMCAKQGYKCRAWNQWADEWLSGENRAEAAAWATYAAKAAWLAARTEAEDIDLISIAREAMKY